MRSDSEVSLDQREVPQYHSLVLGEDGQLYMQERDLETVYSPPFSPKMCKSWHGQEVTHLLLSAVLALFSVRSLAPLLSAVSRPALRARSWANSCLGPVPRRPGMSRRSTCLSSTRKVTPTCMSVTWPRCTAPLFDAYAPWHGWQGGSFCSAPCWRSSRRAYFRRRHRSWQGRVQINSRRSHVWLDERNRPKFPEAASPWDLGGARSRNGRGWQSLHACRPSCSPSSSPRRGRHQPPPYIDSNQQLLKRRYQQALIATAWATASEFWTTLDYDGVR